MLSSELRAGLGDHDPLHRHRAHLDRVEGEHWLDQLLYVDMKTFLPCLNLTYTDKMSMAASTEVRVPLLDDELVDLSGRIPAESEAARLTAQVRAQAARRACCRGRDLAAEGGLRRAGALVGRRCAAPDDRRPPVAGDRPIARPAGAGRRPADTPRNDAGPADNALRIWTMLTLELWQREFLDAPAPSQPAAAPAVRS